MASHCAAVFFKGAHIEAAISKLKEEGFKRRIKKLEGSPVTLKEAIKNA